MTYCAACLLDYTLTVDLGFPVTLPLAVGESLGFVWTDPDQVWHVRSAPAKSCIRTGRKVEAVWEMGVGSGMERLPGRQHRNPKAINGRWLLGL